MFRLNRLTDYAVVVMARMATSGKAGTATAAQISRDTGVPLPTVSKVLNALARYGLIVSQRGAGGGYALSQPAEKIGVADIIQAIEGAHCADRLRRRLDRALRRRGHLPDAGQLGQGQRGNPGRPSERNPCRHGRALRPHRFRTGE